LRPSTAAISAGRLEEVVEDEDGPLRGGEALEGEQEGDGQVLRALVRGLLRRILGLQHGFGEPRTDVELAPVPGRLQVVQAEPGRGLEQPGAGHRDAAAVGGVPAQEHVLRDVLGRREGARHAVGEPDQLGPERA
jgi:hypothetical protein